VVIAEIESSLIMLYPMGTCLSGTISSSTFEGLLQFYKSGQLVQALKAMGIGVVRLPLEWFEIEPKPNQFDFSDSLPLVKHLHDNDIKIVGLVWPYNPKAYAPLPYSNPAVHSRNNLLTGFTNMRCHNWLLDVQQDPGKSLWGRFLTKTITTLGPYVSDWIIGNEPDLDNNFRGMRLTPSGTVQLDANRQPVFWSTEERASALTDIYLASKACFERINTSKRWNLRLGGASLANGSFTGNNTLWDALLKAGFLDTVDFIDTHFYARETNAGAWHPESILRAYSLFSLKTLPYVQNKIGKKLPVQISEYGFNSGTSIISTTEVTKAAFDVRQALMHEWLSLLYPSLPITQSLVYSLHHTKPTYGNKTKTDADAYYGLTALTPAPQGGWQLTDTPSSLLFKNIIPELAGYELKAVQLFDRHGQPLVTWQTTGGFTDTRAGGWLFEQLDGTYTEPAWRLLSPTPPASDDWSQSLVRKTAKDPIWGSQWVYWFNKSNSGSFVKAVAFSFHKDDEGLQGEPAEPETTVSRYQSVDLRQQALALRKVVPTERLGVKPVVLSLTATPVLIDLVQATK
jgi:hypothetical protein